MIEKCLMCSREFDLEGLVEAAETSRRYRRMYWIDRIAHWFPNRPVEKKSAFPGAFALPPKNKEPVSEPPAVIETEVTVSAETPVESVVTVEQPDVTVFAEKLQEHFRNPDVQPDTLAFAEPQTLPGRWSPPSDERATDLIGEVINGKVVSWNTNILGYRSGFIRTEKYGKSRGSLFFKEEDIVTVGRVGVGSHVRCLVCDSNGTSLEAREVEIYLEEQQ